MAGSIKTGPVAQEYEDSEEVEDAVGGDTEAEAEADAEILRVAAHYDCPRCGWHLANAFDRCGNATCPKSWRR